MTAAETSLLLSFDIRLHAVRAGLFHLFRDVSIYVQRECGGVVA